MLATISGKVSETLPGGAVIELAGLGYFVYMPMADLEQVKIGKSIRLYLHEHLRENAHDLYGFLSVDSKLLFEQLISVSGVGPKLALSILSAAASQQLTNTISAGQTDLLQSVPGVGKKMAARIVVELRSKLGSLPDTVSEGGDSTFAALKQLGFSATQARQALAKVPADVPSEEERLRVALKELGR